MQRSMQAGAVAAVLLVLVECMDSSVLLAANAAKNMNWGPTCKWLDSLRGPGKAALAANLFIHSWHPSGQSCLEFSTAQKV